MANPRKTLVRLSLSFVLGLFLIGILAVIFSRFQDSSNKTDNTEQVDALIKQCETKRDQYDFRAALPLCLNAVEAAEKLGNQDKLSYIYSYTGLTYDSLSQYQKAIEFQNKALKIVTLIGDKQGEGKAYGNLGVAYYSLGDYQKAIEYYNKALQIALQIGNKKGEGNAYNNLGNAYYSLGDYLKAIEFHNKALQILQQIGGKQGEGATYGNLGNAYL
jgi:tetratricopeptide (TPR) repeat protein